MTTEELNAALTLSHKIERLQASLDAIRATGGISGTSTNTPVQGGTGVFTGQVAVEIEQEIAELRELLRIEQEIIRREIAKMELSNVERKLMLLRYVECRPWESIKDSIGYSRSQTFKLHTDVIEKFGLDRTS